MGKEGVIMKKSYLFTLGLLFGTLAAFGQGFPNVPQTPGTLLTPLLEHMQGRTAIIEWHNG